MRDLLGGRKCRKNCVRFSLVALNGTTTGSSRVDIEGRVRAYESERRGGEAAIEAVGTSAC
jgi:hypothetical protein